MKPNWKKKGLIYCPSGEGFFKTHATRPVPYRIDDNTLRLFFSSRDHDDRMLPAFIDVEIQNPSKIIRISGHPLIGLGDPGAFDDSGVTLSVSAITHNGNVYFYYTGWKRRRVVSFELSIGVILWDEGSESFQRVFQGPIVGQDRHHPLLAGGPFVMIDDGRFKMWYCSGTDWKFPNGNPEPIYTVFYAESDDGITWSPNGKPVIKYRYDGEVVSAPWVMKLNNKYLMWYSTRGHATRAEKNYSIGYAESDDGIYWERLDHLAGISTSPSGWDSEMVCYPSLYPHEDKIYMFYSGNNVGKSGIGYAVADNFMS